MPTYVTALTPAEERAFQAWVKANDIRDVDHPDSRYDYRGFWKKYPNFRHNPGEHFTDEFKQPGHLSFSNESQYATPENYGGRWADDTYLPQMSTSRQSVNPSQLDASIIGLLQGDTNAPPPPQLATGHTPTDPNAIAASLTPLPMSVALALRDRVNRRNKRR